MSFISFGILDDRHLSNIIDTFLYKAEHRTIGQGTP